MSGITTPLKAIAKREIVKRFNDMYHLGLTPSGERIFDTTYWLGVPIQKAPTDMVIVQEILHRTRPEIVVETGVWHGGSAYYMATLMDLIGVGEVVAVDITLDRLRSEPRAHPRCTFLSGSSTAPEVLAQIKEHCRGKRTMVVLDSDHSQRHVATELELYAPLVSPGCYLICEDTNIHTTGDDPTFGGGPMGALQTWLPKHPEFRVDREAERLLLTFNPSGFLVRAS